ncbi:MAG: outer membrane protein assembly factor BamB family protein, partial [Acidimicrobiales bacterium]
MRAGRAVAAAGTQGLAAALLPGAATVGAGAAPVSPPTAIGAYDWPTYGHDIHHSFDAPTRLNPRNVGALVPRWIFPTKDAVTANPVLVNGTVYVGSWDGHFYAIDATTGAKRWDYRVKDQPAVSPPPDGNRNPTDPNSITSDGGLITASAYFLPGDGAARPDLVIFGAGYTLYALRAADGTPVWNHDYPGSGVGGVADPAQDEARIFSSPVVVGNQVLFGVTSDGQDGHRGYFVSADLATGLPIKVFETDVDNAGRPQNDGCGGVWSSPTVDEAHGLVIF